MSRNSHHHHNHHTHHHAHHGPNQVFGSWGADVLSGTSGRDRIFGLWGDDEISSGAGNDTVFAGWGDDLIIGGAGNNRYYGGHGLDTVSYAGSITDYELNAGCRPWSPISITRLDSAGEGAGVDRLHSIEAIYFAADDYTFHLDGSNNAVLAGDDAALTDEDTALVIDGADLLANDLEFDGDEIAITAVDGTSAAGASVSLVNGEITYDAGGIFDALGEGEVAEDTFTYSVDDGKGGTDTATVTVSITGVNDAPSIVAPVSVSVAENTSDILAVIAATDAENDAITYSVSGGADAALFAIDANTGALTFLGAPDFETPLDADGDNIYDVEVSASDGSASDTASVAVEVTDVEEGPGFEMRLNELHYDNAGADSGEFVEVRVTAGADVTGTEVYLYNGNGGGVSGSEALGSMSMTTDGTFDYYVWYPSSIQNGAPDGMALVWNGSVQEFFSYEGVMDATNGPAAGLTSVDMGVSEDGTGDESASLARDAAGVWQASAPSTVGYDNESEPPVEPTDPPRLNEMHYDNAGADEGEFFEVRVAAGSDVSTLSVVLYNGSNGTEYDTVAMDSAAMTMSSDGTYDYYVSMGISLQNGGPDGIALVDGTDVVEFLSYEGVMTAVDGPAAGLASTDIGVSESGSAEIGQSLWRDGAGVWHGPDDQTPGVANEAIELRVNEIHYDNASSDVGEFVEFRVTAGADVSAMSGELYNGNGGGSYAAADFGTMSMTTDGAFDYYVWNPSSIQNGAPDGVAVAIDGVAVEFFSYEGTMTATDGSAAGMTSVDMGVAETSSTAVGQSLWRDASGTWQGPADDTRGLANDNGGPVDPPVAVEALISEVQGAGVESSMVGQTVTVTAIVVGDFQNGDGDEMRNLGGFYLMEEGADQDADAATSEGIFVFEGALLADVNIGDRVTVTGVVGEFFGNTQITASAVTVDEVAAVADVNDLAVDVSLDAIDAVVSGGLSYVADMEAYEGMLINITDELTVNETFNMDRFNEVRLTAGDRPEQFTQSNDPDVAAYDAYLQEIGSDQIMLDDGLGGQNLPVLAEADLNGDGVYNSADGFGMGDTITGLTGVVDYSFSNYRIRSVEDGVNTFEDTQEREADTPNVGGSLKVVSFNVLNYFTTIDDGTMTANGFEPRGADTLEEFTRQTEKLITSLVALDADVFGLVELENDFSAGSGNAIAHLVGALNATLGGTIYDWVDPQSDHVGGDAISVGMIYKVASVTVVPGSVEFLTDADLDPLGFGALDDDGLGVFEGAGTNRSPLTATFEDIATGEDFSVSVVHLKSKGSGSGSNADIGDGAGASDEMREEGVDVITAWLDTVADEDSLVLGDFNAYGAEDPIDAMVADGYTNLEEFYHPGATTYVFDGQTGTLDYGFGNSGIMDNVTGAAAWHINSNEPDAIDYNTDFGRDTSMFDGAIPYRTSDHDPIIIGLEFADVGTT